MTDYEKDLIKKAERRIELSKKLDKVYRKVMNGEDSSKEKKEYEIAKKIDAIESDFEQSTKEKENE